MFRPDALVILRAVVVNKLQKNICFHVNYTPIAGIFARETFLPNSPLDIGGEKLTVEILHELDL